MSVTITVPDMHCQNCAATIRDAVAKVRGVDDVVINVDAKTVTVEGVAPEKAVAKAIRQAGFKPA